jgi:hypothetical protein
MLSPAMTNFTRRRWFRILVAVGLAMVLLFIATILITSGSYVTPPNLFMASDHEMNSHAYQDYRDGH